jgi:hypothetical protein
MTDTTQKLTGRCLCGGVTFEASVADPHVGACHCEMCRRWGGGGPLMAIPCGTDAHFTDTEAGANLISVYRSSEWAERGFCKNCGTSLFYRLVGDGSYYVPAGLLDTQPAGPLHQQIFIDEKPAFYDLAGDVPAMTGAEVFALYAPDGD